MSLQRQHKYLNWMKAEECGDGREEKREQEVKYGGKKMETGVKFDLNSLPVELRAPDISVTVFRNRLKSHLFDTK